MNSRNIILILVLLCCVVGTVYVLSFRSSDTASTGVSAEVAEAALNMFPYGKQPLNFKAVLERQKETIPFPYPKLTPPEVGQPYQNLFKAN